jgi:hypothetical protein
MPPDPDRYVAYYAEKLWNLIPEVYRTADSEEFGKSGPLREMVNRIAAQAAILRRSIDRMWEDQSIETCDDWVIAYLGELLAVNLVAALDARGQRLDVAKAIYYRRRKGTLPLLEELTADVTEWPARVIEFFRRLGRTRHGLDPAIGVSNGTKALQQAQGLVGVHTGTPAGGYADLRNAAGASRAQTAFDEFAHTADVRRGSGRTGWHNISHLGVFLWRLRSFPVGPTTPVQVKACPNLQYTFDPTGRDIPLFAAGERPGGDTWVFPAEWQMPTPIDRWLLASELANLYGDLPRSLAVYQTGGLSDTLVPADRITADPYLKKAAFFIDPTRGRLISRDLAPAGVPHVTYHYGFSSLLGAGPYERRQPGVEDLPRPAPEGKAQGGGGAFDVQLASLGATGTITLADFLTYDKVRDLGGIQQVTLRAENQARPLIRLALVATPTWTLTGGGEKSELFLEGLFLSGGTLVLAGQFARVVLRCCTLDPGSAGQAGQTFAKAADGLDLAPCRLVVKGTIGELILDRCITGPVLEQGGKLERLSATECIVQSLGAEQALDLPESGVELQRSTVLGPGRVHRLSASECILHDVLTVDDTQHGCIRFSAWANGSVLPRQYESVGLPPQAGLFGSRGFGRPTYARLLAGADARVVEGAADGSEMGAFAREKAPIKKRSLRIKYEEFMPLGLTPVLIDAT